MATGWGCNVGQWAGEKCGKYGYRCIICDPNNPNFRPNENARDLRSVYRSIHYECLWGVRTALSRGASASNKNSSTGETPLYTAAKQGNVAIMQALIMHGADIEKESRTDGTPLCAAAEAGEAAAVELLICHGANIHVKAKDSGCTPLHYGAGHWETAKILIEAGADVHVRDDQSRTPLHKACRSKDGDAAKLLIAHGSEVDVNAKSKYKLRTPLHEAYLAKNKGTIALLIAHGADVKACDKEGWTPRELGEIYHWY